MNEALLERPHLFGLRDSEVVEHLARHGVRATDREARRVLGHLLSLGHATLDGMPRPISRRTREAIEQRFDWRPLELVERVTDPDDGFVKYLFRSPDGALTEAVRIPLHKEGCFTVCLSSQVGCAMRCDFCATGRLGLTRNLAAWEMVAAFRAVRDEAPGRVTGAVFQGQGEPFHNYDEVIRAASILCDPCGGRISAPAITISTVGLVPNIRRYAREGHRFRLIVSLTSAVPERRRRLLPVAGRFSMEEVAEALREYAESTGKRATVAWVLMGGVNHDRAEIEHLRALLAEVPLRLNLIDVNDARPDGYRRATDEERRAFADDLQELAVPIIRRYSGGRNRHAACGMLAAKHLDSISSSVTTPVLLDVADDLHQPAPGGSPLCRWHPCGAGPAPDGSTGTGTTGTGTTGTGIGTGIGIPESAPAPE
jgi:23S rRNA (adenine2503-C2)-methyltransferase